MELVQCVLQNPTPVSPLSFRRRLYLIFGRFLYGAVQAVVLSLQIFVPSMDDISSSLKRLQDSIRGLSDASALVGDDGSPGGGDQIANLNFGDGIFDETSPICTRARTSASSSSLSDGVRGRSYCHAQKPVSYKCAPATSSSMRKIDASSGEQRFEDGDGGLSMRRSGSPGSHIFDHHSREDAIAHDSAEVGY